MISRDFGNDFAQAIADIKQPKQSWFGPVYSGYGQHLVLITKVTAGKRPSLGDPVIRKRVENDWRAEQGTTIEARIFESLRKNYSVQIRHSK